MKLLKMSNSKQCAMVDDEIYDRCVFYNWVSNCPKGDKYRRPVMSGSGFALQNFVKGPPTVGQTWDHMDRNPFNCQRDNLRLANKQQQNANKPKQTKGEYTSRYKGVSWKKDRKYWRAYITVNNNHIYLGSFDHEIDAALAYNKAAVRYFGVFACINEIVIP